MTALVIDAYGAEPEERSACLRINQGCPTTSFPWCRNRLSLVSLIPFLLRDLHRSRFFDSLFGLTQASGKNVLPHTVINVTAKS